MSLMGCSSLGANVKSEEGFDVPSNYLVGKNLTQKDLTEEERENVVKNWWGQFNNPQLLQIIQQSQKNSPTIGEALVNIKNYEAALVLSQSKTSPNLSATGSVSSNYAKAVDDYVTTNNGSVGLRTSWEIDLFGKNELMNSANRKQLENAKAMWHDAQTIVAAEAARTYFNYNFCKRTLAVLMQDHEARKLQNEITKLKVQAGFEAETSFFQNEAGLSQSQSNILAQEAQCDTYVKSLVALTAIKEEELRKILNEGEVKNTKLDLYVPVSVPAELLKQRPDIVSALNKIQISALDLAKIKADALPTISFSGNISASLTSSMGVTTNGSSLSLGPITISLPIFDGGVRAANEEVAKQKYEQAKLEFSSKLRNAVREIEVALINLSSRNDRLVLIENSVTNYKKSYEATLEMYQVGISDLFNLEAARRNYLSEVNVQINNELSTLNAWIDLYKAVGGGFKKVEETNG